jgi:hypothetical protein
MADKLTALEIENLTDPGLHYTGSDYLYVQVKGPKWRSWIFRYTMGGRTQYLGLGSLRKVPLSDARRKARECARSVSNGVNPLEAKRGDRQRRELDEAKRVTFREAADRYIAAHRDTWRSEKHRNQWDATLGTYVFPVLGALPVHQIDTGLVLKIVEPIWAAKSETANRVRGRIETVLDWAKSRAFAMVRIRRDGVVTFQTCCPNGQRCAPSCIIRRCHMLRLAPSWASSAPAAGSQPVRSNSRS